MSVIEAQTEVSPEDRAVKDGLKQITKIFETLMHPLRLKVIVYLDEHGTGAPVDMYKALDTTLGSLAYHVRTLEQKGLIVLKEESRVRGAVKHTYKLTTKGKRTMKLMRAWAVVSDD